MVKGWTKNLLSEMMVNSVTWIQRRKTKNRVLRSRTVLNGGEREQEHVIGASEEGLQARTNLNGGELDEGPIQSDLLYPSLLKKTRAPSGRPPLAFSRSPLDSLLAGFLFFFLILDVALLHKQPPRPRDRQVTMVLAESLVSFFSLPFSSSEERLGCFLEALLFLLPIYFLHVLLLSPRFLLGG